MSKSALALYYSGGEHCAYQYRQGAGVLTHHSCRCPGRPGARRQHQSAYPHSFHTSNSGSNVPLSTLEWHAKAAHIVVTCVHASHCEDVISKYCTYCTHLIHTRTHTHTYTHMYLWIKNKVPNVQVTMDHPCSRTGVHTIFGNSWRREIVTITLHGQLTNALPATWLLTTRDTTEDVALWVRPNPPPPPANNAYVVTLDLIYLQNMSQANWLQHIH